MPKAGPQQSPTVFRVDMVYCFRRAVFDVLTILAGCGWSFTFPNASLFIFLGLMKQKIKTQRFYENKKLCLFLQTRGNKRNMNLQDKRSFKSNTNISGSRCLSLRDIRVHRSPFVVNLYYTNRCIMQDPSYIPLNSFRMNII